MIPVHNIHFFVVLLIFSLGILDMLADRCCFMLSRPGTVEDLYGTCGVFRSRLPLDVRSDGRPLILKVVCTGTFIFFYLLSSDAWPLAVDFAGVPCHRQVLIRCLRRLWVLHH
jgi:hypothetical protein